MNKLKLPLLMLIFLIVGKVMGQKLDAQILSLDADAPGLGASVSISENGKIMAVSDARGVNTYRYVNRTWELFAHIAVAEFGDIIKIAGRANEDQPFDPFPNSSHSIRISGDGKTIAISICKEAEGVIRSYKWNEATSSYQKCGKDISSEQNGESFGYSIALSGNGNVLMVGAPLNDDNGTDAGLVYVYEYNIDSLAWMPKGSVLPGENGEMLGISLACSEDGQKMALSGKKIHSAYKWSTTAEDWIRMGLPLQSKLNNPIVYSPIVMSGVGNRIAFKDGDENVAVFDWNSDSMNWQSTGKLNRQLISLLNLSTGNYNYSSIFASTLAFSKDGNRIAIGSSILGANDIQINVGSVIVCQWDGVNNIWTMIANDFEASGIDLSVEGPDYSGTRRSSFQQFISISGDGNTLGLGRPYFRLVFTSPNGLVQTFNLKKQRVWQSMGGKVISPGNKIAINSAGNQVVIGSNDQVKIYKWNSDKSTWYQFGNIIPTGVGDYLPDAISSSKDGKRIAINNIVYSWDEQSANWKQLGKTLPHPHIAFSSNGNFIAVSNSLTLYGLETKLTQEVLIFKWNEDSLNWITHGSKVVTENILDSSSTYMKDYMLWNLDWRLACNGAFSENGEQLWLYTFIYDGYVSSKFTLDRLSYPDWESQVTFRDGSHNVKWLDLFTCLEWNEDSGDYFQKGGMIALEGWYNNSEIAVSSDGNTIVIGSKTWNSSGVDKGVARVYTWGVDKFGEPDWIRKGARIFGRFTNDPFGRDVGISADGNKIIISTESMGYYYHSGENKDVSNFRVLEWNTFSGKWEYLGYSINAYELNTSEFKDVAISADGNTIAGITAGHFVAFGLSNSPDPCARGKVVWDGAGDGFFKNNEPWKGNQCPCAGSDVLFNGTGNKNKNTVINDTTFVADFSATTAYSGRLKMEGSKAAIFADDIDLRGSMFTAEKNSGKISCDSFSLTFNAYAETGGAGLDAASLFYVRGSRFSARSNAVMNLRHFYLDRMGVFNAPGNDGAVNLTGNFTREFVSNFNPGNGTWNFIGDQNSSLDPGVGTNNPVRVVFHNLNIAKTDSNTLSITNNDTIQVNGNFAVNGTNSRVQGGVLNAKGNISMGKSWLDGAFNRVLITGTANQTISCDTASEFSETVVLHKPSGKVLLGKDLSLGSVRFNSGILDPNGKKFILTGNDISGQNVQSNIKDRAYVLKTNGAFSGNSITVPLSNGDRLSLNSISLNTSGSHNDWQLDYVAGNPSDLDADLDASLTSISSTGYWRVQRLSSSAGSAETFLKILAGSGFDQVALLDGGAWRSIGGSVSGNSITSTESNLFASSGDWYITAGVASAPTAPNQVVADKDMVSGKELEINHWSPSGAEGRSPSGVEGSNGLINPNEPCLSAPRLRSGAGTCIHIYPNPAQQILHVQLPEGAQRFSINDLSGRVLASYNAGQQQVNISKLSEGMYLISTEINGKKYTVRFVKE